MSADPRPVALVGAGPGDPDLLTLDAEAALAAARVVVADRSLRALLADVRPGDDVGAPDRTVTFVDDHRPAVRELLAAAAAGPGVVRLYLGDPWFHPAGDAERAALRGADVPVEVVPGVAEELAALAAAGIPAQVRTLAVTTTFATDEAGASTPPGGGLPTDAAHTLVVRTDDLAGTVRRLAADAERRGVDPSRAAAAVATGPDGRDPVRAALDALGAVAPSGRGVVVVGLVAALDTRRHRPVPAAPVDPGRVVGGRPLAEWLARPGGVR